MALRDEFRPKLAIVVDLAVQDDPEPAALVRHRLRAGVGEVDDAQPCVAKGDVGLRVHAAAVWPAVLQQLPEARRGLMILRLQSLRTHYPGDAAHASFSSNDRSNSPVVYSRQV